MEDAVILGAVRSPLARAVKGALRATRIDDVAAHIVKKLMTSVPGLAFGHVEDVLVGCAMPEGEQGYNIARTIALLAGFPVETGGVTINRFCASSLEAINQAALNVRVDNGSCFIAGGIESMSHVPIGGFNPSFNEQLMRDDAQDAYITTGASAENIARHYAISRAEQDRFAVSSHRKAVGAQVNGIFDREVVPVEATFEGGRRMTVARDECPRPDASIEALGALAPAFMKDGSVTAGNSSPLSDGAAFAIIASRRFAKKIGAKPIARIRGSAVVGVDPSCMGLGPVEATPKALSRAGMKMKHVGLVELGETCAAHALAAMRLLNFDEAGVNVHGGSIALGHPLGATGARMVATAINAMHLHDVETSLVTMCVGGGQGMALILERI